MRARGESPRFVDGLRITDQAALDAVVAVLAGRNNTALVAAIGAAGGRAVGLTGADCAIGLAEPTGRFTTAGGDKVDLGLVGRPVASDVSLLRDLLRLGYIPVVASIGVTRGGTVLNVNADTLAGHLAAELGAARLVVAGGTAGVLDASGTTIERLAREEIARMTATGAAHSGMIAKLAACERALDGGVPVVAIVNGRGGGDYTIAPGTRIESAACRA
ncbi:MAG: acetylglutamate kinase [Candidatus Rokuibacteriota bacterium]|nr:MAG: acetylglutamate kinase [Candidatus Rokubacteria bacterium]